MITTQAPVTVSPEAAAFVARHQLGAPLAAYLGYALQHVPDLVRVEVTLDDTPNDAEVEPALLLQAIRPTWDAIGAAAKEAWVRWEIATYPPDVTKFFVPRVWGDLGDAG